MVDLIHGAGQTDGGICGANVNLALIRRDESCNAINVGGMERQVHGEGTRYAPHSGCR
jgi:hypothetical protein